LLEASTWRVQFENDTFATWFPEGSSEKSPLSRFPGFLEDRARKMIQQGRPYSFDSEIKIGSKPTCLRTTVTALGSYDGERVMFECIDVSKEMQQEHLLDSFAKLADRRNRELEKAYKVIKEQHEKMKRDLEAAARVQQSYLPSTLPPTDRARFAWAYRPCDELAGDIFNVVQIDDRHVGMYVVDVSGHGVPSALLSVSVARNLIPHSDRSSLVVEPDADGQEHLVVGPADVASRLNGLYRMDEKNRYYFTLLYGLLDTREGLFRYASAGHPGPIRVRPSEPPRMYSQQAIPIGMMDVSTYEEAALDLRTGDRLYLYSDGVTEETNPDDEPFGDERVLQALDESRELTLDESVQSLVESVLSWHGATQLSDDLSVLAVEVQ
jgi:sigma-B regulation protein RsbU (phosphoserine phosphatase)